MHSCKNPKSRLETTGPVPSQIKGKVAGFAAYGTAVVHFIFTYPRESGWEYRTFKVDRARPADRQSFDAAGNLIMGDPALYSEQYHELARQGWTLVPGPYGNVFQVFPMMRPKRSSAH